MADNITFTVEMFRISDGRLRWAAKVDIGCQRLRGQGITKQEALINLATQWTSLEQLDKLIEAREQFPFGFEVLSYPLGKHGGVKVVGQVIDGPEIHLGYVRVKIDPPGQWIRVDDIATNDGTGEIL